MVKIKKFPSFFKADAYQNLLSQALRDAGTKSYKSPNIMTLMADFNSKKGDHDKGVQYIERAQKLATEVLDGVKVHQKYINILGVKSDILLRKKMYAEAIVATNEIETLVVEIYGNK